MARQDFAQIAGQTGTHAPDRPVPARERRQAQLVGSLPSSRRASRATPLVGLALAAGREVVGVLVHTPVHASWLNQAEIYFSIIQRKVLTPNHFPDLDTLEQRLLAFGRRYEQIAQPFEWKFTRADLDRVAQRLDAPAAQAA
jgi:hypothetical protein